MTNLNFEGPHEFHVTANPNTTRPDEFMAACEDIGVEAHVILNETPGGVTTVDYLTGSEFFGPSHKAFIELGRVAGGLTARGIDVVREKIETLPIHPDAPKIADSFAPRKGQKGYFESHFTLPTLPGVQNGRVLRWKGTPFYISTTRNKQAKGQLFATMRDYHTTAEEFSFQIKAIHEVLAAQLPGIAEPVIEYALYDSNPAHDKEWVGAYEALKTA